MKINISAKELKEILSDIVNIGVEIGNTENFMNKPEEPTVLSDEEVHNKIVKMCMKRKLVLYINEVPEYVTDSPDYDSIAETLSPYAGEIVSIINDEKDEYKLHVFTL